MLTILLLSVLSLAIIAFTLNKLGIYLIERQLKVRNTFPFR